uniref:Putative secreted protein n=1 Tax=Anopheles marajoara TaxID=58244 RepID=A0A2M4CE11_9DIPT
MGGNGRWIIVKMKVSAAAAAAAAVAAESVAISNCGEWEKFHIYCNLFRKILSKKEPIWSKMRPWYDRRRGK